MLLLASAGPAWAAERVVASTVEVGVNLPRPRADRVRANLLGGFANVGFTLIPESVVQEATGRNAAWAACASDACFQALGAGTNADWVLVGRVDVLGSRVSADLRMLEVASGRTRAKYASVCGDGVCTIPEAADWMSDIAAQLRREIDAGRAVARPAPALAAAPLAVQPVDSSHEVGGQVLRGFGIATGVAGLGLLGMGLYYKLIDETLAADRCDATGNPCYHHTLNGWVVGFSVGGGLLVAAAVMNYFGWRDYGEHKVAVVPAASPTGAGVTLRLVF